MPSPIRISMRSLCLTLLLILVGAAFAGATDIPLDTRGLPMWEKAVFTDFPVRIRLASIDQLGELLDRVPIADFQREQIRHTADTPFSGQIHFEPRITESEAMALREAGYDFERLPDLEREVREEMERVWAAQAARGGEDFRIGERGVYHTYAQLGQILQDAVDDHPSICVRGNIGSSVQGRTLWTLKLSDNVGTEEAEPEVRISSTMHGNEPISMEMSVYLIEYLTDHYGQAGYEDVTNLINNYEIHFLPLHNPDGHVVNNRRNANNVDLNRNFPVPDGSIGDDGTYSEEVETWQFKDWGFDHHFVISQNGHSGALVVNYPWDYTYSLTPDDDVIIELSEEYSYYNSPMWNGSFYHGITNGAQWYIIKGGLQDWSYQETGCIDVTLEFSNSFAPPAYQLDGYWDDNRESFMHWIKAARYGVNGLVVSSSTGLPLDATITVTGNSKSVVTDPDFGDYYKLLDSGSYTLTFEADDYATHTEYGVSTSWGTPTVLNVQLVSTTTGLVSGHVHEVGGIIPLDATIEIYTHPGGTYVTTTTSDAGHDGYYMVNLVYGDYNFVVSADEHLTMERQVTVDGPTQTHEFLLPGIETLILVDDDMESGAGLWTTSWSLTTSSSQSPMHSMTDSPGGDYSNNQDSPCTLADPVNLCMAADSQLSFYARWDIENNWDCVQLEISTNGGSSWTALATEYTHSGSGQGEQPSGEPVFEGTQPGWVLNTVDLSSYENEDEVYFRFMLRTDTSETEDGFYFDDFLITGTIISTDAPENAPVASRLEGNWPNPFNPSTTIRFTLGEAGPVELAVYDIAGRRLALLAEGVLPAGEYERVWNGRDEAGRPMASGVYLARFLAGGERQETKLTLLK